MVQPMNIVYNFLVQLLVRFQIVLLRHIYNFVSISQLNEYSIWINTWMNNDNVGNNDYNDSKIEKQINGSIVNTLMLNWGYVQFLFLIFACFIFFNN